MFKLQRIKQKIDIFGNSFSLYDAQDIKIQDDETAVSLSHDNELKKPIVQAADDIPTEKKDLGESIVTPKYGAKKLKIIFVLLLVVGFLLSLEENVQTKDVHQLSRTMILDIRTV